MERPLFVSSVSSEIIRDLASTLGASDELDSEPSAGLAVFLSHGIAGWLVLFGTAMVS
jgi:hypothetical protein